MRRSTALIGALACSGGALWSSPADAVQMNLTRAELCTMADAVVVGEITDIDTLWSTSDEAGGLERHAFMSTQSSFKGPFATGAVVVLPGGTLGDFQHWVEDVPELKAGVTYTLFLSKVAGGYEVIGGEAGAIEMAVGKRWRGESVDYVRASLEGCRE